MSKILSIIPDAVNKWGNTITVTEKGAIFSEDSEKMPSSTIIDLIKKLATAETACGLAEGDLVNFLIGVKGKDLAEIAAATGISASDLKKRSNTCARIAYDDRDPQLHLDFHIEAAKSKADDPSSWLTTAKEERLTRARLKKSVELDRLASDDDMKPVIEDNDGGTENFGVYFNRIVGLNGKLNRDGSLDKMSVEDAFELHADFMPVLKVWAGIVARFKGKLDPISQAEFEGDLKAIEPNQIAY